MSSRTHMTIRTLWIPLLLVLIDSTCTAWGWRCRTWWRNPGGGPTSGGYNETHWDGSTGSSPVEQYSSVSVHTDTHTDYISLFLQAANGTLPPLSYSSYIHTATEWNEINEKEVSLQHARTRAGGRFGLVEISLLQSSQGHILTNCMLLICQLPERIRHEGSTCLSRWWYLTIFHERVTACQFPITFISAWPCSRVSVCAHVPSLCALLWNREFARGS